MSEDNKQTLRDAINNVESGYEFMLAYAAQGRDVEHTGGGGGLSIREYLKRIQVGLSSIADDFDAVILSDVSENAEFYTNYVSVLRDDAKKAKMGIDMVMSLPSIGSQVVDNLNANIHVRAVLTDVFLLDEALTSLSRSAQ
ncbi:MAG: hypothetical protein P8J14_04375 [Emcibacteraceae bacterium]|nr:hypothetical protein [Emcibacteraceae bacterium]